MPVRGGAVRDPGGVSATTAEPAFPPEPWRSATVPPEVSDGPIAFTCPRCRTEVEEAAYGPCTSCRAELRALGGDQRDVVEEDYVPKMNVTPNAVALKD
jgi:hypothetical protein